MIEKNKSLFLSLILLPSLTWALICVKTPFVFSLNDQILIIVGKVNKNYTDDSLQVQIQSIFNGKVDRKQIRINASSLIY